MKNQPTVPDREARAQGKRLGRSSIPVTIERKIRDALKKGGTSASDDR